MKRGKLIVIDGIDGSGKSTQLKMLKKTFPRMVIAHDPGGTPEGEMIRGIVLGPKKLPRLANFFLFLASRAALLELVVEPALQKGRLVICDRFDSSTYAYQVRAGKKPGFVPLLRAFTKDVLQKAKPDAYIILDSDPMEAKKRLAKKRKSEINAYDKKPLAYHKEVRKGFKEFRSPGSKVYIVDADRTPREVFADVSSIVRQYVR